MDLVELADGERGRGDPRRSGGQGDATDRDHAGERGGQGEQKTGTHDGCLLGLQGTARSRHEAIEIGRVYWKLIESRIVRTSVV